MRTWLKDKYPKGIGLGDLVREYCEIRQLHSTENRQRKSEIVSTLNFLNHTKCTPTFSDEFGTMYLNGEKVN